MTELERGTGRRGTVRGFDEAVGLGSITGIDGREYPFHCIEIADGTRRIAVGAEVTFVRLAKLGRYEAAEITS